MFTILFYALLVSLAFGQRRITTPRYTVTSGSYLHPVPDSVVYTSSVPIIYTFDFKPTEPQLVPQDCPQNAATGRLCGHAGVLNQLQAFQYYHLKAITSSIFHNEYDKDEDTGATKIAR